MRETPAGVSPEKDRWLLSELKSGMDDWDPGQPAFERVVEARRQRVLARRRNGLVGGLAMMAVLLLGLTFLPPARSASAVAGGLIGGFVGVQTPPPAVGRSADVTPTPVVTATPNRVAPPAVSVDPGQQREPLPAPPAARGDPAAPSPPPAPSPGGDGGGSGSDGTGTTSDPPVVAGPKSPATGPAPAPTPTPFCLLHLLCL
jgi:hypothetical protein